MFRLLIGVGVLSASMIATDAAAQARRPIEPQSGDLILVRGSERVRIVRRLEGNVRVVHNPQQRWLVVLLDEAKAGAAPDGQVDVTFNFQDVDGQWPLGERWEGPATVDEYSVAGEMSNFGLGLTTGSGLVQVLGGPRAPRVGATGVSFKDTTAIASVTYSGSGRGTGGRGGFDQAEDHQINVAMRNAPGVHLGFVGGAAPSPPPPPDGPVRVGGNIRTPRKIQDAEPVTPPIAVQAGIRGVVILEVTIGTDGSVADATILRSIPLLDQAAIDTVRKWKYAPTLLNGVPVPVIMTATVNFQ
jgi:TonB family protein